MKKRAKIITTIASLCLAVALMAFGVYAATSVSFNISSKVSFTVSDVFVDITGNAYLGANGTSSDDPLGAAYVAYSYYTASGVKHAVDTLQIDNTTATSATASGNWEVTDAEYDTQTSDLKVTYILTIVNQAATGSVDVTLGAALIKELTGTKVTASYVNNGATAVYIKNNATPTAADINNEAAATSAQTVINVAAGNTLVVTIVRELIDTTTSIVGAAGNSIDGSVTIANHTGA